MALFNGVNKPRSFLSDIFLYVGILRVITWKPAGRLNPIASRKTTRWASRHPVGPPHFVPVQEHPGQRLHLVREVNGELATAALCGRSNVQSHAWQRILIGQPGPICRNCLRVQAAAQKEQ